MVEWIKQHAIFISYASTCGTLEFYSACPYYGVRVHLNKEKMGTNCFSLTDFTQKITVAAIKIIDGETCVDIEFK